MRHEADTTEEDEPPPEVKQIGEVNKSEDIIASASQQELKGDLGLTSEEQVKEALLEDKSDSLHSAWALDVLR